MPDLDLSWERLDVIIQKLKNDMSEYKNPPRNLIDNLNRYISYGRQRYPLEMKKFDA